MQPEDGQQERDVQRLAERAARRFTDCKKSEHRVCIKESESGRRAEFTTDCVPASG